MPKKGHVFTEKTLCVIFDTLLVMRFIIGIVFFILPSQLFATIELGGNFTYSKQIVSNENCIRERVYEGSIAGYFFSVTAIELIYSDDYYISEDGTDYSVSNGIDVTRLTTRVYKYHYGIGLRQAFASPKSFIVPLISVGYARRITKEEKVFDVRVAGITRTIVPNPITIASDSVFGKFTLQLKISRRFSLNTSVRTLFKAFEYDQAKNNIKYMAGFSLFL